MRVLGLVEEDGFSLGVREASCAYVALGNRNLQFKWKIGYIRGATDERTVDTFFLVL